MKIDFRRFMRSETWTVGVVIDLRCNNETAVRIFAEVRGTSIFDIHNNFNRFAVNVDLFVSFSL